MRRPLYLVALIISLTCVSTAVAWGDDPVETVRNSEQVLAEIMAIPARSIPERLLAEAQGIAIVPNVIKIGFIAGGRRGHGVVLVRDKDGEWTLPQFITLTGGSIGWQAGIQGSDIILVFTTKRGVEGLLNGKFTIGADVAAAAGPVGRNAAAATDGKLQAEILSYSRSRGLFLGASIDGSVIEVDQLAHQAFYGSTSAQLPTRIPVDAVNLRQELSNLAEKPQIVPAVVPGGPVVPGATLPAVPGAAAASAGASPAVPVVNAQLTTRMDMERRSLVQSGKSLQAVLSPQWQQYLALPPEIAEGRQPSLEVLSELVKRYDLIAKSPNYAALVARPEFQSTHELLRAYLQDATAVGQTLPLLPPPPGATAAAATKTK